jgi:hypothetical protein
MPRSGYPLMPRSGYQLMPRSGYQLMPRSGYQLMPRVAGGALNRDCRIACVPCVSAHTQDMADDDGRGWSEEATNPDPPVRVFRIEQVPDWVRDRVSKVLAAPRGTRLVVAPSQGFEDPRSEERAELLIAMAQELAPELVGLTVAEALARVSAEPGLSLRHVPKHGGMEANYICGRITAWTRAGQIGGADAG